MILQNDKNVFRLKWIGWWSRFLSTGQNVSLLLIETKTKQKWNGIFSFFFFILEMKANFIFFFIRLAIRSCHILSCHNRSNPLFSVQVALNSHVFLVDSNLEELWHVLKTSKSSLLPFLLRAAVKFQYFSLSWCVWWCLVE